MRDKFNTISVVHNPYRFIKVYNLILGIWVYKIYKKEFVRNMLDLNVKTKADVHYVAR